MEYDFLDIEKKWQAAWDKEEAYKVEEVEGKPKFYALDMFPYPSGAGHVGHPLGYIASDVISRYKGYKGFNVAPYGIRCLDCRLTICNTDWQHPAITTEAYTSRYREQMKKMDSLIG